MSSVHDSVTTAKEIAFSICECVCRCMCVQAGGRVG